MNAVPPPAAATARSRWMALVHLLAAKPLTLAGFALLAASVLALQFNVVYDAAGGSASAAWVAVPLALLALNLSAAMVRWPSLRRGGLGVFHLGLLLLMLLAAWGRLTHFNGRIEIADGAAFDAGQVVTVSRGPWSSPALEQLQWRQGPIQVAYGAGLKRGRTLSEVQLPAERGGTEVRLVGDDTPLVLEGYRFYTTHNKGYAPVLSWRAGDAVALTGSVHMPSYPLREWQQDNRWVTPDGRALALSLKVVDALDPEQPWALRAEQAHAVLTVRDGARQWALAPGDAVDLGGATLRYERLGLWMGYTVFRDPTLLPMLVVALAAVAGLAWHLWRRMAGQPVGLAGQGAGASAAAGAHKDGTAAPWGAQGGRA